MNAIVMRRRTKRRGLHPVVRARIAATMPTRNPMSSVFLTHGLRAAVLAAAVAIAGCATPMPRKDDPHEAVNRKMFAFNEFADRVAIRPVAVAYRKVTNDTSRRLISNFFANLESPITLANDLLQANPK